jgi:hypothetical protein
LGATKARSGLFKARQIFALALRLLDELWGGSTGQRSQPD